MLKDTRKHGRKDLFVAIHDKRKYNVYKHIEKIPMPADTMDNNPRSIAVDILNRIDKKHSYAEPLLDAYLSQKSFSNIHDKRLLTYLVYGTLRMRNQLDWVIQWIYKGRIASMDIGLKNILRTALYQFMHTDKIPAFAAVHEAVKITKQKYPGRDGLVNALLRNAIRKKDEIKYPDRDKNPVFYISIVYSHPEWLVMRWLKRFSMEETIKLCKSNNETPPLTLRVNALKANRAEVTDELTREAHTVRQTEFSSSGIILSNPVLPVKTMSLYAEGAIQVQDEASQLIASLVDPQPGEKILDLCSGIGIKTTHLAELMKNSGRITAVDINRNKGALLKVLSQRLSITITEPHTGNAAEDLGKDFHDTFDRVLVDAPCSGLGTLRRNPEIKWRLRERNIKDITSLQRKILHASAPYPKRGGIIVYSTCSIEEEENEAIIKDFLAHHPEYECIKPVRTINEAMITKEGFFKTYPHRHGTDGFFGAVLIRK